MRIVYEKLEHDLAFEPGKVSLLHIADHPLFSRYAYSLISEYAAGVPEPAAFFDKRNKEIKPASCLFVVGDILSFDLNDKRIVTLATKKILAAMIDQAPILEQLNYRIEEQFEEQAFQMEGDYALLNEWDLGKYLKMAGFGIDSGSDTSLFGKSCHFLRIASDLFPKKIIGITNLLSYLSQEQFDEFCNIVAAKNLMVYLVETDDIIDTSHLENSIHVDENYLEF